MACYTKAVLHTLVRDNNPLLFSQELAAIDSQAMTCRPGALITTCFSIIY
jgi:hypothetical protein